MYTYIYIYTFYIDIYIYLCKRRYVVVYMHDDEGIKEARAHLKDVHKRLKAVRAMPEEARFVLEHKGGFDAVVRDPESQATEAAKNLRQRKPLDERRTSAEAYCKKIEKELGEAEANLIDYRKQLQELQDMVQAKEADVERLKVTHADAKKQVADLVEQIFSSRLAKIDEVPARCLMLICFSARTKPQLCALSSQAALTMHKSRRYVRPSSWTSRWSMLWPPMRYAKQMHKQQLWRRAAHLVLLLVVAMVRARPWRRMYRRCLVDTRHKKSLSRATLGKRRMQMYLTNSTMSPRGARHRWQYLARMFVMMLAVPIHVYGLAAPLVRILAVERIGEASNPGPRNKSFDNNERALELFNP